MMGIFGSEWVWPMGFCRDWMDWLILGTVMFLVGVGFALLGD